MKCQKQCVGIIVGLVMLTNSLLAETSTPNLNNIYDMQLKAYTTQLKYESMIDAEKQLKDEIRGSRDHYFWLSIALSASLAYSATR